MFVGYLLIKTFLYDFVIFHLFMCRLYRWWNRTCGDVVSVQLSGTCWWWQVSKVSSKQRYSSCYIVRIWKVI